MTDDLTLAEDMKPAEPVINVGVPSIPPDAKPMDLLSYAIQNNGAMELLDKLMALQERHDANEARKEFIRAMAAFRSESIEIIKRKHVRYQNRDDSWTEYRHEDLGEIIEEVVPKLSLHGLFHRWRIHQADGNITVTCVLSHEMGHSEETQLIAAPDSSGGKNSIQGVGSTTRYLERYTFMAACGLAAKGMDDDGRDSETIEIEYITDEQIDQLKALIKDVGFDMEKVLAWISKNQKMDVTDLSQLKAGNFEQVYLIIKQKQKESEDAHHEQETPEDSE